MNRTLSDPDVTDAERLDALMDFVDDLREVRLRYSLAALLKVDGFNVPPGGRGKGVNGAGDLTKKASSRWPRLDVDSTFNRAVRNIAAHRDYHFKNDHVVFTSTLDPNAIRIPWDQFSDADHHLHIRAEGTSTKFPPLVAGLTVVLPDRINTLGIDCTGHHVIADINAFRAFETRGELDAYEDAMATITTCAAMRIDGVAPYPDPNRDWARFVYWVAATARVKGLEA